MNYNDFIGHTPGPWHEMKGGFTTKGNPDFNLIQIYATNDDLEMITKVYRDGLLQHKVQDFDANARLIAAAPSLLARCQELERWKEEAIMVMKRWDAVHEAAQESPGFTLGCDIPTRVAEMIEENKRLREALITLIELDEADQEAMTEGARITPRTWGDAYDAARAALKNGEV